MQEAVHSVIAGPLSLPAYRGWRLSRCWRQSPWQWGARPAAAIVDIDLLVNEPALRLAQPFLMPVFCVSFGLSWGSLVFSDSSVTLSTASLRSEDSFGLATSDSC